MAIRSVGVLGCGLMGSGIAQVTAQAGFPTVVAEASQELLDRGLGGLRKGLDRRLSAGLRWFSGSGGVWWTVILPSRGTVHGKGESLPVRRVSWPHDSPSARDGPREGRSVGGSRTNGESWRPGTQAASR